ncbi:MAG TPA: IS256 family transposase, partial [Thermoplasmataceae archaeon]|nr:IS256 family transposase [Thermoplasmataceae archaeon]
RAVKEFMESLMKGEIQAFLEDREGRRNGYYKRDIGTRYGKINDLRVPRDRNNEFQTALFQPYQRSIGIDDLVVSLYAKGISTRKMAEILEELFHSKYSRSTISRITDITVPEIRKWQSRPLDRRYIAIFLDAMFLSIRRETVEKECIIFAMGIRESGYYEIMGFYMNPVENHIAYRNVLMDLHERGVVEPLLFIADGLPGIEEEIRQLYPRADFQLCTIHASRNFESHVRVQDRNEIDSDLKEMFLSRTREEALDRFNAFRDKWSSKYPRPVYNMEKSLGILLKYHDYPEPIRRSIHSTNLIERMNKEIRRRIKIIDSLPSEDSAMKIIYLRVAEINDRWSQRSMRGFYKCKDEIREMFQKRYPL